MGLEESDFESLMFERTRVEIMSDPAVTSHLPSFTSPTNDPPSSDLSLLSLHLLDNALASLIIRA